MSCFLGFWRRLDLLCLGGVCWVRGEVEVSVCVCAGGGVLEREHNKLFVFIMNAEFEKRIKVQTVSYFHLFLGPTQSSQNVIGSQILE